MWIVLWQGEGIEALLRTADIEAAAVQSSVMYNCSDPQATIAVYWPRSPWISLEHVFFNMFSLAVARHSRQSAAFANYKKWLLWGPKVLTLISAQILESNGIDAPGRTFHRIPQLWFSWRDQFRVAARILPSICTDFKLGTRSQRQDRTCSCACP